MEDVKRMLELHTEYAELSGMFEDERPRSLDDVASDYAVALSGAMAYCAPNPPFS